MGGYSDFGSALLVHTVNPNFAVVSLVKSRQKTKTVTPVINNRHCTQFLVKFKLTTSPPFCCVLLEFVVGMIYSMIGIIYREVLTREGLPKLTCITAYTIYCNLLAM